MKPGLEGGCWVEHCPTDPDQSKSLGTFSNLPDGSCKAPQSHGFLNPFSAQFSLYPFAWKHEAHPLTVHLRDDCLRSRRSRSSQARLADPVLHALRAEHACVATLRSPCVLPILSLHSLPHVPRLLTIVYSCNAVLPPTTNASSMLFYNWKVKSQRVDYYEHCLPFISARSYF